MRVFGPSRAAARLESSAVAKRILAEAAQPRAECFMDAGRAVAHSRARPTVVIKADGLASGSAWWSPIGATRPRPSPPRALEKRLGQAGRALIEEFLAGRGGVVIAVCDGRDFVLLPAARDHKRAFDGDLGSNTGGMGARPVARGRRGARGARGRGVPAGARHA